MNKYFRQRVDTDPRCFYALEYGADKDLLSAARKGVNDMMISARVPSALPASSAQRGRLAPPHALPVSIPGRPASGASFAAIRNARKSLEHAEKRLYGPEQAAVQTVTQLVRAQPRLHGANRTKADELLEKGMHDPRLTLSLMVELFAIGGRGKNSAAQRGARLALDIAERNAANIPIVTKAAIGEHLQNHVERAAGAPSELLTALRRYAAHCDTLTSLEAAATRLEGPADDAVRTVYQLMEAEPHLPADERAYARHLLDRVKYNSKRALEMMRPLLAVAGQGANPLVQRGARFALDISYANVTHFPRAAISEIADHVGAQVMLTPDLPRALREDLLRYARRCDYIARPAARKNNAAFGGADEPEFLDGSAYGGDVAPAPIIGLPLRPEPLNSNLRPLVRVIANLAGRPDGLNPQRRKGGR